MSGGRLLVLAALVVGCDSAPSPGGAPENPSGAWYVTATASDGPDGMLLDISAPADVRTLGLLRAESLPQPLTGAHPVATTASPRVNGGKTGSSRLLSAIPEGDAWCLGTVGGDAQTDRRCVVPADRYHLAPRTAGQGSAAAPMRRRVVAVRLRIAEADREIVFSRGPRALRRRIRW